MGLALHIGSSPAARGRSIGDGRYEQRALIATGGMATVFEGWDTALDTACAIKIVSLGTGPASREDELTFRREAFLLASLSHPGIVRVRDFFSSGEFAYLIMDLIDGSNLYDRHKRMARPDEDHENVALSPVPEGQVLRYGTELASALSYLHGRKTPILYRDLKPHNVMRQSEDGRIILLDFGIARTLKSRRHEAVGTPGYAAPEQYYAGGLMDQRSDLYSLGVLLYELATGYNPREEKNRGELPAARDVRPAIGVHFSRILARCVALDPNDRYDTADELLADLRACSPGGQWTSRHPSPTWERRLDGAPAGPAVGTAGRFHVPLIGGGVAALDTKTGTVAALAAVPTAVADTTSGDSKQHGSARRTILASVPSIRAVAHASFDKERASVLYRDASSLDIVATSQRSTALVVPSIAAAGESIVAAWTRPDGTGTVHGLSAGGIMLWSADVPAAPESVVADERITIVSDADGCASAIRDGKVLWRRRYTRGYHAAPPVLDEDAVYLTGAPADGWTRSLDRVSGQVIWDSVHGARVTGSPRLAKAAAMLVLPTRENGVLGLSTETGQTAWRYDSDGRVCTGVVIDNTGGFALVGEYGTGARLTLLSSDTGKALWDAPLPYGGTPFAPIVQDGVAMVISIAGIATAWSLGI